MPLKGAQEFIEELVRAVQAPPGCAISVTERDPTKGADTNWRAAADIMPIPALSRYDSALAELRRQHPRIDWTAVTDMDGDKRRVARWFSEV